MGRSLWVLAVRGADSAAQGCFSPRHTAGVSTQDAKAAGWRPLKPRSHTRQAFNAGREQGPQFPSTAASPCIGPGSASSQHGSRAPRGKTPAREDPVGGGSSSQPTLRAHAASCPARRFHSGRPDVFPGCKRRVNRLHPLIGMAGVSESTWDQKYCCGC